MNDVADAISRWGSLLLSVALIAERAWSWVLAKKFATREEVLAAIELVKNCHHRVDLVEKDLKALPDYERFNELSKGINELREFHAGNREWREGMRAELERIHSTLNRLDQRLSPDLYQRKAP